MAADLNYPHLWTHAMLSKITLAAASDKSKRSIPKMSQRDQVPLQELLALCLGSHDELLWTEFVQLTQPIIARTVVKMLSHWTKPMSGSIDDLVQETYAKLFADETRALRRFVSHHEHGFYGFLKVVTANTVQDYFRRCFAQKRGSGLEEATIDAIGDPTSNNLSRAPGQNGRIQVQQMEYRILIREIDNHLRRLGAISGCLRDYQIFWLYYREGLSAKSISCIPSIGLTVKGVESLLLRLTQTVRLKMNPQRRQAALPAAVASHGQFAKNPSRYSISEQ